MTKFDHFSPVDYLRDLYCYYSYQEFINQECSTESMLIFQFIVFLKVL